MNESHLDKNLKTLSENSPREVPRDFNAKVWEKIRQTNVAGGRENWFSWSFWQLTRPRWVMAALVVGLVAGWGLGRLFPSQPAQNRMVTTVTGEVIDLACYYDVGACGPDHAACARACIESGLPVGLKTKNGRVYVLVGKPLEPGPVPGPMHEALNKELAEYAAKTVTVTGTVISKEGVNVIENTELMTRMGQIRGRSHSEMSADPPSKKTSGQVTIELIGNS